MARAEDRDIHTYYAQYLKTAEELDFDADPARFQELWMNRNRSDTDMAQLLAEVQGIAYDEALAWVEERDTP